MTQPTPTAPSSAELTTLRALLEKASYAEARVATETLLSQYPTDRDLLYLLAVGQRLGQQIPRALDTLERLEDLHPQYPRLFQERGHCYVGLRDAPRAIEAFEQAVKRNPSLPASWKMLEQLYRMTGRLKDANEANRQATQLAALPADVVTAASMYSDGEVAAAEELIRQYLLTHEQDVEAMGLLAQIGIDLDIADDAQFLLETALELQPSNQKLRHQYALVLLKQHKHLQALTQLKQLLATDPKSIAFRITYASIQAGMSNYEEAIPLFKQLIQQAPREHDLFLSLGHAQKTIGEHESAVASYRQAVGKRASRGEAYWSLANLKTYRFTADEITSMRREEANTRVSFENRSHLCFALGKALEDQGEYAESFQYYERGNALKKGNSRYRPKQIERNTALQQKVCTRAFFESRKDYGLQGGKGPIFIVGLPRAGSTLIEQILASHSEVEGTMELAEVQRLAAKLLGRARVDQDPVYPQILTEKTAAEFADFGREYLKDTEAYRTGKPIFIDKMPNNFRHIGLIHLMLPNAKIIDARRDAMDCCFSNFKQLFASGQQFTYSFEDISGYYRSYVELMAHWDQALPGKVLRVQHEDLVADLEGHVRRILDFCELDFEQSCVDFHKTERRVHTASSEQVRKPISRDGIGQWKRYEPWLQPLQTMLGDLA